ncbi:hypothetical protein F5Y10DRAFT_114090 [Nemania abortiva]|nr:hypothetical protein F5Y10DRAFT_114090 [Nemania abortiva]
MKLAGTTLLLAGTSLAFQSQPEHQIPLDAALAAPGAWLSRGHSSPAPSYRDELLSLHKALVEISSVTYTENAVGNFLVDYLHTRGFVVSPQFVPATPESEREGNGKPRFNVIARPGPMTNSTPSLLVTSHIDTVPPYIPYSRSDEQVSADTSFAGRGSVDDKASVAVQITAVTELLAAGLIDPKAVTLLFVVGEERTGDGMRYFSDQLQSHQFSFKAAIFGEPTEGKLACGHKGYFGCNITAHGKAGHSGYPWLGKSATEVLMRGLLKVLDTDLGSSDRFGNTTINVGTIHGGVAPNVIAELATAQIAGRVAIGPEPDGGRIVKDRVIDVLKSVDKDAFEVQCNDGYGVVKCACDVPGFETDVMNYGTDVPNLKGNHIRYLYGPGTILVAHAANEAIQLADLESGVEGYKKLILHALKEDVGEL